MSNVDIYTILSSKPHNAHYLRRYYNFILACCQANSSLPEGTYTEKHHICPKASDLFPEYKDFRSNKWNKAVLTARQHFIAHWMLWKVYGGSQSLAFKIMNDVDGMAISSSKYEKLRISASLHCKGKAVFVDKNGNRIKCNVNDDRVVSGELTSIQRGKVRDANSTKIQKKTANLNRFQKDTIQYTFYNIITFEKIICNRTYLEHRDNIKLYRITVRPTTRAHNWIILQNGEIPEKYKNVKLYHISGEILEIPRYKICEKFGIKLEGLFYKKNPAMICYGWSLSQHEVKIFTIQHKNGIVKRFTRDQMIEFFGKSICEIFRPSVKSYKGWKIISTDLVQPHKDLQF